MFDWWNKLPEPVKPIILPLVLVVAFFMLMQNGYLYLGRTFDREMKQCEDRATEYKRLAFRGTRDLTDEASERARARHQPTLTPLKDAEPKTLSDRLDEDEKALKK